MRKWWGSALIIFVVATGYICWTALRPLHISSIAIDLDSPTTGRFTASDLGLARAAVGYIDPDSGAIQCRALGEGEAYTTPQPTASLAKLITVQVVLDKYPLNRNENGDLITMSDEDAARYWTAVNNNGSSVRVTAGEQISQRQLIEGVLLASANNMADSLAIWAFGSIDNYHQAAREWLDSHNLTNTVVGGDASGFSPETKSTPADLCRITLLATQNPVLVQILAETEATMPTGEIIHTTNRLLGQNGIIGGKTGYTDEAGAGLIMAGQQVINNVDITVAAVTLSHDSYATAFDSMEKLAATIPNDLGIYTIKQGDSIGVITTSWGGNSEVAASRSLVLAHWIDQPPLVVVNVDNQSADSLSQNTVVGKLVVGDNTINLLTTKAISGPGMIWRLTNPLPD